MFSCKFAAYFQNTFYHLWVAASDGLFFTITKNFFAHLTIVHQGLYSKTVVYKQIPVQSQQ